MKELRCSRSARAIPNSLPCKDRASRLYFNVSLAPFSNLPHISITCAISRWHCETFQWRDVVHAKRVLSVCCTPHVESLIYRITYLVQARVSNTSSPAVAADNLSLLPDKLSMYSWRRWARDQWPKNVHRGKRVRPRRTVVFHEPLTAINLHGYVRGLPWTLYRRRGNGSTTVRSRGLYECMRSSNGTSSVSMSWNE